MRNTLIVWITAIAFLVIGLTCLFYPKKIQEYTVNFYVSGKGLARLNPFIKFVKSPKYLYSLRAIGFLGLGVFFLVIYLMFFRK